MLKICPICNKPFRVQPSEAHKRLTCSYACMAQEYKTRMQGENNPNFDPAKASIACGHCQTIFRPENNKRIYCSRACFLAVRHQKSLARVASGEAAQKRRASQRRYRLSHPSRLRPVTVRKTPTQIPLPFSGHVRSIRQRLRRARLCPLCVKPFKDRNARLYCPGCSYVMQPCVICHTPFRAYRTHNRVTCSPPCRKQRRSISQQGSRSHRWQGGKTSAAMLVRTSVAYKEWRRGVFERDDYTCALCEQRGGKLAAHHIHRFADRPDLALEVSNGITLCWPCHGAIHGKETLYIDQFLAYVETKASRDTIIDALAQQPGETP